MSSSFLFYIWSVSFAYQVEKILFKVPEVTKVDNANEKPKPSDWWVVNAPVFEPVRFI